ncbi:hypothetical protein ACFQ60_09745 [Streptomyces zhihengii]
MFADPKAGREGLVQVVESCGALLVAMVRTTPPDVRGHHVFGASDPEGFAAMGVVETLVHTHDVAEGLGLEWEPPAELCARVLTRLFPDVPAGHGPWPALLWATGRGELPGLPRRTAWRWYGERGPEPSGRGAGPRRPYGHLLRRERGAPGPSGTASSAPGSGSFASSIRVCC